MTGQERQFGYALSLIIGAVGGWRLFASGAHAGYWLAAALALAALTALFPRIWVPVLRVWLPLGHALGWVNTRIILGVVFFVMIVPMGWVLRRLGHDPLRLRRRSRATYWVKRDKEWPPASFKDQF